MKGIVITQQNCRMVHGRLVKFFHRHENFLVWHQFDGGMRKRIGHYIMLDEDISGKMVPWKFDDMRSVHNIQIRSNNPFEVLRIIFEHDRYDPDDYDYEGFVLSIGDEVLFLGSRIVVKTRMRIIEGYDYLYQCFQIIRPGQNE